MVRIRKNANALTIGERDRFLETLALLNDQGLGKFQDYRDMHVSISDREAHREIGFLPWHRSYLLDLERELQNIDPTVCLPYWRFDQPAPNLFTSDFIGVSNVSGNVVFSASNPLQGWATDGIVGVIRSPRFNVTSQAASGSPGFPVIDELATLGLGSQFSLFAGMEGTPHGAAHVSFTGSISSVPTAAKDPLFFLLHCNVDRLWAKWQWINDRFDTTAVATYPSLGTSGSPGAVRVGHNLLDTMWPWNGVTTSPRPNFAPRTPFPSSSIVAAPGNSPQVGSMVDYQGLITPNAYLAFDYDDVPFEPTNI